MIRLDNNELLTEGPAVAQYIADQKPDSLLLPPVGDLNRYRVVGISYCLFFLFLLFLLFFFYFFFFLFFEQD